MIEKSYILDEIRRTAADNGGSPLGSRRFSEETGIKQSDWLGKHWARWGDALQEAGFSPNRLQSAYDDEWLLERLTELVRELGHFPVPAELKMKAREDSRFPSHNVFRTHFGRKDELVLSLIKYCESRPGYDDVIKLCGPPPEPESAPVGKNPRKKEESFGSVYLLKSGRYYKIGRSNAVGRRERELAIQLPEKTSLVHAIKTDDPPGIERYWHERFKGKRKRGEWFELTSQDVSDFKRRKFM
ncbi:MAG: GIY-YIG nuclease family protein [Thermodesulfobacteriota bacterium]